MEAAMRRLHVREEEPSEELFAEAQSCDEQDEPEEDDIPPLPPLPPPDLELSHLS